MSRRSENPLFRATALVAALCVLMLAVFAASPALHAELHAGAPDGAHHAVPVGETGHVCAVTLFAQGVPVLLVFCLLMLARPRVAAVTLRADDELVASRPRYGHVPSHAPPAA
jgi:hypothetical protein